MRDVIRHGIRGWQGVRWGVARDTVGSKEPPSLLGEGWHDELWRKKPDFEGQMPRVLMFQTRAQARAWCRAQRAKYTERSTWCARWRFRPVKVSESVIVLGT